jgi:IS5 family transposase
MLSKNSKKKPHLELFRSKLSSIINMYHHLVIHREQIDWDGIYNDLLPLYSTTRRPSVTPRLIVGLLMPKRMFKEIDESIVDRWIENSYWQYFTGEQYFQNKQPIDPSEFVHFRKRLGEADFEQILSYTVSLFKGANT